MKTLTQAWELIQLLSSLHFLSPSLVRSVNPQTYALNCVYSEKEVDNSNNEYLRGSKYIKHIITCRDLSCDYYRRLFENRRPGPDAETAGNVALGATAVATLLISEIAAPFTFGLSLLVAVNALAVGSLVGGDIWRDNSLKKTIEEIENELKEKWENEQKS